MPDAARLQAAHRRACLIGRFCAAVLIAAIAGAIASAWIK